jgi:hypothetical protein
LRADAKSRGWRFDVSVVMGRPPVARMRTV